MLKLYNPTYGALFEFDEMKPADPKEIGSWILSYSSPKRGLLASEITELRSTGKIGQYPDEFYLVDGSEWSQSRVLAHKEAIETLEAINEQGPLFHYEDHLGNENERIKVHFVPGPIVDLISGAESDEAAVSKIYELITSIAAARFKNLVEFQRQSRFHARNLVEAIRHPENKPLRQSLLESFL